MGGFVLAHADFKGENCCCDKKEKIIKFTLKGNISCM